MSMELNAAGAVPWASNTIINGINNIVHVLIQRALAFAREERWSMWVTFFPGPHT